MAKLIALVEQLIAVTCSADPSGIQAVVPVPELEKLYREKGLTRLRATVARATGQN